MITADEEGRARAVATAAPRPANAADDAGAAAGGQARHRGKPGREGRRERSRRPPADMRRAAADAGPAGGRQPPGRLASVEYKHCMLSVSATAPLSVS